MSDFHFHFVHINWDTIEVPAWCLRFQHYTQPFPISSLPSGHGSNPARVHFMLMSASLASPRLFLSPAPFPIICFSRHSLLHAAHSGNTPRAGFWLAQCFSSSLGAKPGMRTFLVVQWLRIRLPTQGPWVWTLVGIPHASGKLDSTYQPNTPRKINKYF